LLGPDRPLAGSDGGLALGAAGRDPRRGRSTAGLACRYRPQAHAARAPAVAADRLPGLTRPLPPRTDTHDHSRPPEPAGAARSPPAMRVLFFNEGNLGTHVLGQSQLDAALHAGLG